jgi:hypothetical protein
MSSKKRCKRTGERPERDERAGKGWGDQRRAAERYLDGLDEAERTDPAAFLNWPRPRGRLGSRH